MPVERGRRRETGSSSLPYARPAKKKGWSITELFSYLNPFRTRDEDERKEDIVSSDRDAPQSRHNDTLNQRPSTNGWPSDPASTLARRGHEMEQQQVTVGHGLSEQREARLSFTVGQAPQPPSNSPHTPYKSPIPPSNPASPKSGVEFVTEFLQDKSFRQEPVSIVEAAGIVKILQEVEADAPRQRTAGSSPFKFASSPSRSLQSSFTSSSLINGSLISSTGDSPSRLMSRNPNGTYSWQGAGTARPPRYRSPAQARTNKRRRSSSVTSPSTPRRDQEERDLEKPPTASVNDSPTGFPVVSNNADSASTRASKPHFPPVSVSYLRTSTPVRPSPLRQSYQPKATPSPGSSTTSTPEVKTAKASSRAADIVSAIIRDSDAQTSEFSNPYQSASPVKVTRKAPAKRARTNSPAPSQSKAPKPDIFSSPLSIIEATAPKDTFLPSKPPSARPARNSYQVDEPSDKDKSTSSRWTPVKNNDAMVVEDLEDEPLSISRASSTGAVIQPSEVVELDAEDNPPSAKKPTATSRSTQKPGLKSIPQPSPLRHSWVDNTSTPVTMTPQSATYMSPKDRAKSVDLGSLPDFESRFKVSSFEIPSAHREVANAILALPLTSLPSFDFSKPEAKKAAPHTGGFNWAAAGLAPQQAASNEWTCSLCMLKNPSSALKCTICETNKPIAI